MAAKESDKLLMAAAVPKWSWMSMDLLHLLGAGFCRRRICQTQSGISVSWVLQRPVERGEEKAAVVSGRCCYCSLLLLVRLVVFQI